MARNVEKLLLWGIGTGKSLAWCRMFQNVSDIFFIPVDTIQYMSVPYHTLPVYHTSFCLLWCLLNSLSFSICLNARNIFPAFLGWMGLLTVATVIIWYYIVVILSLRYLSTNHRVEEGGDVSSGMLTGWRSLCFAIEPQRGLYMCSSWDRKGGQSQKIS